MAILLHIDSSGPVGMVMLSRDGKVEALRRQEGEREHAGHLNAMISSTLSEAGVGLADVDAFVVCHGPGSYTGVRIGLATAKGFCYALDKPILLHNRLFLLQKEAERRVSGKDHYAAILPARSGEYFATIKHAHETLAPTHILNSDLENVFRQNIGDQWLIIGSFEDDLVAWKTEAGFDFIQTTVPDPETWAILAETDFKNGVHADLAYSEPDYLKPAFIARKS